VVVEDSNVLLVDVLLDADVVERRPPPQAQHMSAGLKSASS